MANTRSARKRARQSVVRTARNRSVVTAVKTRLKQVRSAIKTAKKDVTKSAATTFSSSIDKAVKSGRVHKNKANRLKSKVAKGLAKLA